jgi:dTDP-4-dehydrorhamnose 3,5-epimerase
VTFHETELAGAYRIELSPLKDDRGFFARTFCGREFEERGLRSTFVQCNLSFNRRKGTLRGLHFQLAPHAEAKLVRCTRGAVFDAIVDLRRESATFGRWTALELSQQNRSMLYVPEGFAHGYLTLDDDSEVFYQVSEPYRSDAEAGLHFDDPDVAIAWPFAPVILSSKDRALPRLSEIRSRMETRQTRP